MEKAILYQYEQIPVIIKINETLQLPQPENPYALPGPLLRPGPGPAPEYAEVRHTHVPTQRPNNYVNVMPKHGGSLNLQYYKFKSSELLNL